MDIYKSYESAIRTVKFTMDANTLKLSFSNTQIRSIKSIWEDLNILEINLGIKRDDCSIGSTPDNKYSIAVPSLPPTNNCTYCTTADAAMSANTSAAKNCFVYLSNIANFQHRIASKIYQYELKAAVAPPSETNPRAMSIYDVKKLVSDGFEPIKSRYQIMLLLALITVIVDCLDTEKPIPKDLVQSFTDAIFQADILEQEDYHLFGQSLVNTIMDLNRSSLTYDDQVTLQIFIALALDLIMIQRSQVELSSPNLQPHTPQLNYNLDSLHSPLCLRSYRGEISRSQLNLDDYDFGRVSIEESPFTKYEFPPHLPQKSQYCEGTSTDSLSRSYSASSSESKKSRFLFLKNLKIASKSKLPEIFHKSSNGSLKKHNSMDFTGTTRSVSGFSLRRYASRQSSSRSSIGANFDDSISVSW